jgi:hypothetical protein
MIEDVRAATLLISGMAKNEKEGGSRTALLYYWCTNWRRAFKSSLAFLKNSCK